MERHTRQGVARGQGHGTLDREDVDLGSARPWAATSHTGMAEQGRTRKADPPRLQVMGVAGCWCGLHNGHDWPGKDTGAPHPRVAP